jgi:hypothetical protein
LLLQKRFLAGQRALGFPDTVGFFTPIG